MLKSNKAQKNKERGITLTTLVITIIVLLILAGVSLNGLFGDSGIISNAQKSKEKSEIATEKETIEKASVAVIAKSRTGEVTVAEMQKAMNETTRRRNSNSNK